MARLPTLTARKLLRALGRLGFTSHHQHGTSHLIVVHKDGRRASIPVHPGDIPRGTLRGILRDLEITPKDLQKDLRK